MKNQRPRLTETDGRDGSSSVELENFSVVVEKLHGGQCRGGSEKGKKEKKTEDKRKGPQAPRCGQAEAGAVWEGRAQRERESLCVCD